MAYLEGTEEGLGTDKDTSLGQGYIEGSEQNLGGEEDTSADEPAKAIIRGSSPELKALNIPDFNTYFRSTLSSNPAKKALQLFLAGMAGRDPRQEAFENWYREAQLKINQSKLEDVTQKWQNELAQKVQHQTALENIQQEFNTGRLSIAYLDQKRKEAIANGDVQKVQALTKLIDAQTQLAQGKIPLIQAQTEATQAKTQLTEAQTKNVGKAKLLPEVYEPLYAEFKTKHGSEPDYDPTEDPEFWNSYGQKVVEYKKSLQKPPAAPYMIKPSVNPATGEPQAVLTDKQTGQVKTPDDYLPPLTPQENQQVSALETTAMITRGQLKLALDQPNALSMWNAINTNLAGRLRVTSPQMQMLKIMSANDALNMAKSVNPRATQFIMNNIKDMDPQAWTTPEAFITGNLLWLSLMEAQKWRTILRLPGDKLDFVTPVQKLTQQWLDYLHGKSTVKPQLPEQIDLLSQMAAQKGYAIRAKRMRDGSYAPVGLVKKEKVKGI